MNTLSAQTRLHNRRNANFYNYYFIEYAIALNELNVS